MLKISMNLPTKTDYLNYFDDNRVPNAVAVTLTLKQRVEINDFKGRFGTNLDSVKVSNNTRDFMNRLNQRIFRNSFKRNGKRLSVLPITEGNSFIRLHIHMTCDDCLTTQKIRNNW